MQTSHRAPGEPPEILAHDEVARRRTFAIISHPDAGKTTLTEKLLLYGGAIRLAGAVKARRAARHATSDWMAVEQERGISVTSSVLQFEWAGARLNLLDTPGHQDFSEDTFRTLTAADCAVMLLDNRRGVEEQTRALFEVCRLRRLPIFTFVNKCDRPGQDPLELIDDVESDLGIPCAPVTWPVLDGANCVGVYERHSGLVHPFVRTADHGATRQQEDPIPLDSDAARSAFPDAALGRLREEIDLLDGVGASLSEEALLAGRVSPTFFGSALLNFGVEPFLRHFLDHAPAPGAWEVEGGRIDPRDPQLRGFVFKIQANMDPRHRDRIAFVRICSGRWQPGATVRNLRSGKEVRLTTARMFLARDRQTIEEAVAGDVVGLHDRGSLHIGDTLSEDDLAPRAAVPRFSPERFARISPESAFARKQLDQGLRELSEEGVVHVLYEGKSAGGPHPVVAVVGQLQFEVLLHRLRHEYGVEARLSPLPYHGARWITGPREHLERLGDSYGCALFEDHRERPLLLFESEYALRKAQEAAAETAAGVELHLVS